MQYVLGIDSGGTKYLVRACGLDGGEIAEHVGPPVHTMHTGWREMGEWADQNIDACLVKFGGKRADCAYLVCGTTGIDTAAELEKFMELYGSLRGFTCPILCVNDAEVAQYAATGGVGALVIAGTGSVAFGRNSRGETARSGGWHQVILGNDGSGTWMWQCALYHMTLWLDKRVRPSLLSERVSEIAGIRSREDLFETSIRIMQGNWQDPGLAAVVSDCAQEGDEYAVDIIRRASECTFDLANSLVEKLKLHEEPRFKVAAWGSAIVKSPLHFELFRKRFEEKYDNVDVLIAEVDAAMGAVQIALDSMKNKKINSFFEGENK